MKKLSLFLIGLLMVLSTKAQMPAGTYKVLTWQVANSKEVIVDGVFPDETKAKLTFDDDFIILSFCGYPATLFSQGEWKQQDKYHICQTTTYKERIMISLVLEKVENLDDSWILSVYYNENHIERFSFYKIDTE